MRSAVFVQVCAALALGLAATGAGASLQEQSGAAPKALPILSPRPVGTSDPLPDLAVPSVTIARSSAFGALQVVLAKAGSGIGLTYAGAAMPESLRRPVSASNLAGRLPVLVEQLAQVAGFYYRYDARARVLTVAGEQEFALALPPDASQSQALEQMLSRLGASGFDTGRFPGLLTYRTTRTTEAAIRQALAGPEPLDPSAGRPGATTQGHKSLAAEPDNSSTASGVAAIAQVEPWTVRSGEKISDAFRRWGERSGWTLVWQAPELQATLDASLKGTFEHAVTEVVRSLDANGAHLRPIFYAGNRVLRITGGDSDE